MDVSSTGVLQFNPDVIGALVVHYTYDGLGRVVRVQRPHDLDSDTLDITDLYSDGVRVVQEVGWKNVPARPVTSGTTGAPTYYMPRRANEMGPPNAQTTQTCGPNPQESDWLWADRRLEREYVYAADPGGYVDECIAQLVYTDAHEPAPGSSSGQAAYRGDDTSATILYVLSDHNMNVIGLANDAGDLIAQYGYTPYGELRSAEHFATPSGSTTSSTSAENLLAALGNRLGHQGLRVERFDRPWDAPMPQSPLAVSDEGTGAYRAVCHNRNRMYDPAEGRFMSRDPNGLGGVVLDSLAFGGSAITASDVTPNITSHYGDGMNAHLAYGAMPRAQRDALGLFFGASMSGWDGSPGWDPFDMVDDYIAEDAGSKAAFLERVIGGGRTFAYLGAYAASWVPGPIGWAGAAATAAMGVPDELQGTWLLTAMNTADLLSMRRMMSRMYSAATRTGVQYALSQGARTAPGAALRAGGVTQAAIGLGDYARHVYKILRYGDAKLLTAGSKSAVQAHKLLEWRHVKDGAFGNIDKGDLPAVILTRAEHLAITNQIRQLLPYGVKHSKTAIMAAYKQIYAGHPEWLVEIERYFR